MWVTLLVFCAVNLLVILGVNKSLNALQANYDRNIEDLQQRVHQLEQGSLGMAQRDAVDELIDSKRPKRAEGWDGA